jgi:hypothetical protein
MGTIYTAGSPRKELEARLAESEKNLNEYEEHLFDLPYDSAEYAKVHEEYRAAMIRHGNTEQRLAELDDGRVKTNAKQWEKNKR